MFRMIYYYVFLEWRITDYRFQNVIEKPIIKITRGDEDDWQPLMPQFVELSITRLQKVEECV